MKLASTPAPEATRSEGLRRMQAFLPRAGRDYASTRNYDLGPTDRHNVSTLSPYLRHRLVCEDELVRAVLAVHSPAAAQKFVEEVCWRTYWKGWLELRPSVWGEYRTRIDRLADTLGSDGALEARWRLAVDGSTGIECFDAWARELVATGYLHNHTRMWFASIWIFTLSLPWELGADFFLRHLLDADPASNTLSWRWVAGLHTRGKSYLARPGNITRYTEGRFEVGGELASVAPPLRAPPSPPAGSLRPFELPDPQEPAGLLLTEDDLRAESLPFLGTVRGIAGLACPSTRSPLRLGPLPAAFARRALDDGLERAAAHYGVQSERLETVCADTIADWARGCGVEQIVTAFVPVGPTRDLLDPLRPELAARGLRLVEVRRRWDALLWPHARAGYFRFKPAIAVALAELGIAAAEDSRVKSAPLPPAPAADRTGG